MLQPQYVERFRCLGADCEDTCCDGWGILIDRAAWERYQGTPEAALVEINSAGVSDSDYAKIRLSGTRCPALDDGLCSLHRDHGEPYLSDLCSSYPRIWNVTSRAMEKSLHLSCPEAARLVLGDPEAMALRESEASDPELRRGAASDVGEVPDSFRDSLTSLIRDRSVPIWQRLVSVGWAIEQWGHGETVNDQAFQLETVLELIVGRIGAEYTSPRFLDCYREFMQGLGWTAESTMVELTARYRWALDNYYAPFMACYEHLMENYLLNYMFRTLFPYGRKQPDQKLAIETSPARQREAYVLLAAHYAIVRTVLVGMAALHRHGLSFEHAVKAVQSTTKAFQHSGAFTDTVLRLFAARPEGPMRAAAMLVME